MAKRFIKYLEIYLIILFQCIQTSHMQFVNVALGKPTEQKDAWRTYKSSLAVDGNRDPLLGANSCTHTASYSNTWWLVDLTKSYFVRHIHITNRLNVHGRLRDFYIYVSGVDPNPIQEGNLKGELCLHYPGSFPTGGPHALKCASGTIYGRYVYLWKPKHDQLTLCEFEVFVNLFDFSVHPERKVSANPYMSPGIEPFSTMDCIRMCLTRSRVSSTVVQVNKASEKCECIDESSVKDSADVISHSGWTLIRKL